MIYYNKIETCHTNNNNANSVKETTINDIKKSTAFKKNV